MGRRLISIAIVIALAIAVPIAVSACGALAVAPASAHDEAAEPDPRAARARPDRVRVRAIRVAIGDARTREQAEARAAMLARAARADDFSQLASEYGDGEGATDLGSGGIVIEASTSAVPEAVREAALGLDVREVSAPIDATTELWILQRID